VFDLSGATAFLVAGQDRELAGATCFAADSAYVACSSTCPEIHVCTSTAEPFVLRTRTWFCIYKLLPSPLSLGLWPMSVSAAVLLQHVGSCG
jgi:hypothetical protein